MTISIDIEGPVFSQISFAHVVREIAFALEDIGCIVSIQATDKGSQGYKNVADERNYDRLITMVERKPAGNVKILYNFPVSMANRCRGYNFAIVSWETTAAPGEWIRELNIKADQVWSISEFVNEAFLSGGLDKNKARVIPMGVDPTRFSPRAKQIDVGTSKKFKFLHLGVAQIRKGTPLLLQAYSKAFTAKDDVSLIVKSNGFGVIDQLIESVKQKNGPEIRYIYEETHENKIAGYYTATDCIVYPVHSEGAGLPVLESLACGRPAIVPLWSGLTDFCNASNSFSVKHKIVPLKKPYSNYSGSVVESWAELSEEDLIEQLKFAYKNQEIVRKKGQYAASYIGKNFTWINTAIKILENINEFVKDKHLSELVTKSKTTPALPRFESANKEIPSIRQSERIAVLSHYKTRLESYFYAKASLEKSLSPTIGLVSSEIKDKKFVSCIPTGMASATTITNTCLENKISIIQIHWDRSLFPKNILPNFIRQLHDRGMRIILCINDEMPDDLPFDFFYLCRFVVVNSIRMRNAMLQKGCPLDRIRYIPPTYFQVDTSERVKTREKYGLGSANCVIMSPIYASSDFSCLNVIEQMKNCQNIPHVRYIVYFLGGDKKIIEEHANAIKSVNNFATIITESQSEKDNINIMSIADVFLLPYESKSKIIKNPALVPLLGFNIPIVSSPDCTTSEIEGITILNSVQLTEITNLTVNNKVVANDIKDYIKTMESIYYHISNASEKIDKTPTQTAPSISRSFDIEKPVNLSEL